jgi:hypothetical protein
MKSKAFCPICSSGSNPRSHLADALARRIVASSSRSMVTSFVWSKTARSNARSWSSDHRRCVHRRPSRLPSRELSHAPRSGRKRRPITAFPGVVAIASTKSAPAPRLGTRTERRVDRRAAARQNRRYVRGALPYGRAGSGQTLMAPPTLSASATLGSVATDGTAAASCSSVAGDTRRTTPGSCPGRTERRPRPRRRCGRPRWPRPGSRASAIGTCAHPARGRAGGPCASGRHTASCRPYACSPFTLALVNWTLRHPFPADLHRRGGLLG